MMVNRRGLGKGMGCGYRNLVPKDPMIHGLSAKGVKSKSSIIAGIVKRSQDVDDKVHVNHCFNCVKSYSSPYALQRHFRSKEHAIAVDFNPKLDAKFERAYGLIKADKVIGLLKKDLKELKIPLYMFAYHNGREDGYALRLWFKNKFPTKVYTDTQYAVEERDEEVNKLTFFIAENRNSDDIVVYEDTYSLGNLTDTGYHNRKYFRTPKEASEHIDRRIRWYHKNYEAH